MNIDWNDPQTLRRILGYMAAISSSDDGPVMRKSTWEYIARRGPDIQIVEETDQLARLSYDKEVFHVVLLNLMRRDPQEGGSL